MQESHIFNDFQHHPQQSLANDTVQKARESKLRTNNPFGPAQRKEIEERRTEEKKEERRPPPEKK